MSNGDSVTQTEGLVTVTEGFPIKMNCTYQTTNLLPFLSWYVQYLNKVPKLLLRSATDNKRTEHQAFHATLHKRNSSFNLQETSVQLSDSALYYCALSDTVRETTEKAAHKHVREALLKGRFSDIPHEILSLHPEEFLLLYSPNNLMYQNIS